MSKVKAKASPEGRLVRPEGDSASIPTAQTLLRWNLLRMVKLGDSTSVLQAVPLALRPIVLMRSGGHVRAIEGAQDAEDVIALAAEALGAAEQAWHLRLKQFGPRVVPLLAQALRKSTVLQGERRCAFLEHEISAFYWFGEAGAAALLGCWEALDDYGKSQASVVLGLLGHQPAAELLWEFLRQTQAACGGRERLYVGPLWGLIDLGDARAADAIASFLGAGKWFYELPDFVALAGDLRCVEPVDCRQEDRQNLMMTLTCILKRSGELPFAAEVERAVGAADAEAAERFVQDLAGKLAPQCDAYMSALRER
jgi:hypothetical protein